MQMLRTRKEGLRYTYHSLGGYTKIVRLLLEHGANPNAEDNEGWTPLHLTSSNGHTTTVRLLLDRGASADVKNNKGRNPLQVATTQGMDEIVQVLARHGAQVIESRKSFIPIPADVNLVAVI